MQTTITKQQARQFLLQKQLLLEPQSLTGKEGIETVFNTLRVIQYDPLNPCGRNPDLVLQSRIANTHPNQYHHWLYTEQKGIEVYDKELSIIPIDDFPYSTHRNSLARQNKTRASFLKKYQQELAEILQRIEQEGAITSSDIKINQKLLSGWGSQALFGRLALEALWKIGELTVIKRDGMKKYYDLSSRIQKPQGILIEQLTPEHILRRLNSVGILPKSTTGGGWQGLGGGVAKIISQLIKEKRIIEFTIKGCKLTYLIDQQQFSNLQSTTIKKSASIMVFIAPLDNLIWDRAMTEDLFNFHYRWEVYTPKDKRKYGYYTLPILYGTEFIGRIEPIKKNSMLEIRGLWKEKVWDKKTEQEFQQALNKFSNYLNVEKIEITYNDCA